MLNLPKTTEIQKFLPKKAIYTKFQVENASKVNFDKDVSKIVIVNEISHRTLPIKEGQTVKAIYVVLFELKRLDYQKSSLLLITKLIKHHLILVLHFEDKFKIATFYHDLQVTEWLDDYSLTLNGLTLDEIWQNIIIQVGKINLQADHSLDEQLLIDKEKNKLKKEIEQLTKKIHSEKQSQKKFELLNKLSELKAKLNKLG